MAVLTGAGASTESSIPDYRGPRGAYSTGFKPMTHQQFTRSPEARARYWARSFAGWHEFSRVQPNATHEALARLQAREQSFFPNLAPFVTLSVTFFPKDSDGTKLGLCRTQTLNKGGAREKFLILVYMLRYC